MATPPPNSSTAAVPTGRRFPWLRRLAWLAFFAAGALVAIYGHALASYARTGTAYGARIGCSCRFIEGRPIGTCRKDFEGGMGLVTLSEDPAAHSVTARFALAYPQTATYVDGVGCQLEPWRN